MNLLTLSLAIQSLPLSTTHNGDGLGEIIISWFRQIGQAFVDMAIAIPTAFANIFSGWVDTVTQDWYGPVYAALALLMVGLIIYAGFWIKTTILE